MTLKKLDDVASGARYQWTCGRIRSVGGGAEGVVRGGRDHVDDVVRVAGGV